MLLVRDMVTQIKEHSVKELIDHGELVTYTVAADLFYDGQIPVVAYLLIKGNIHLQKGKKIIDTLSGPCLIGAKELMSNIPAKHSAQIMPKSEVCFLSKSDITEILELKSEISKQFDKIINV